MCRKALPWGMVCILLISGSVEATESKSVFAVASHNNGKIKAYLMDPNGSGIIHYQATIAGTENFGQGAGGAFVFGPLKTECSSPMKAIPLLPGPL